MEIFRILGTIAIDNTKALNALDETGERAQNTSNETESTFGKAGTRPARKYTLNPNGKKGDAIGII